MTAPSVAITGLGLCTGMGRGTRSFWDGLLAGRINTSCEDSGVVHGRAELLRAATAEALGDAGLEELPRPSLVVVCGQAPRLSEPVSDAARLVGPTPPALPGTTPPDRVVFLSHACASVGFAVAYARTFLRAGTMRSAMVLGTIVSNDYERTGMSVVRALSKTAARPFAPDRDGTWLGEGAGAMVLERVDRIGEGRRVPDVLLAGVSCRVGADSIAGISSSVASECIRIAMLEAGLEQIDYVHAHATGTKAGDVVELDVLRAIGDDLGWSSVPVSSHKGAIGHLLHASMFPGVVASVRALRTGIVPGTPGLTTGYRDGCLRVLAEQEVARPAAVLTNGFGFGGNHSALVVRRRWPASVDPSDRTPRLGTAGGATT